MVYDTMLLFGVLFIAILIPSLLFGSQPAVLGDDPAIHEPVIHDFTPMLSGPLFQLYLLAVIIAFFCYFWLKNGGQTLGMQAWRLQLQDHSGAAVTLKQCLLRFFSAALSLLPLGAGYWWIWLDKDRLSWHDRWSKTRVVVLPKS